MTEQEPVQDDLAEEAADLILEAEQSYQESKEVQHELLQAAAEEDGAPYLETQCEIYGHAVPVSGRLTGELITQIEELDEEVKRRSNGESDETGVSDIVEELASILGGLVDDKELTADEFYKVYLNEGAKPIRTISEEVLDALQKEDKRVSGEADGFRSK